MEKTPLYEAHFKAGGKIVDFHGWLLPVQYKSILQEHEAVRTKAGLFDVSHMGEIKVSGSDALQYLQRLLTNDISRIGDFQEIYSPMCYGDGGTVDDLIVYRISREEFLLIVNASNIEKDYRHMLENRLGNVTVENVSESFAQIALQGPSSQMILQKLTNRDLNEIKFFHFMNDIDLAGIKAIISRSGYTGEDGFEIYISPSDAIPLWDRLLEVGDAHGLMPAGLGARDTLRFESSMPLYGQELSESISPLEAGLARYVKLYKEDFIGRKDLVTQLERGLPRKLTGLEMVDRGIPRSGFDVLFGDKKAGFVTSGGFAPSVNKNLAMALIDSDVLDELRDEDGGESGNLRIVIRDKALKVRRVEMPFYSKKYKRS